MSSRGWFWLIVVAVYVLLTFEVAHACAGVA